MPVLHDAGAEERQLPAGDAHPGRPRRADIQGLRGIAVLLVVLYHSGWSWFHGGYVGVDVFFVISGFLITGLLVREATASGLLSLTAFYARRARRILPVSTLVLVVCGVLSLLVLPPSRAHDVGWLITSAAGFVVNWVLAGQATDYLRQTQAPSVVQHYWTLGVEEQFYLLWPLLILLALQLSRGRHGHRDEPDDGPGNGRRLRLTAGGMVGLLCVASLVWSVVHTSNSPDASFFQTTTRAWELGLGAALALAAPALALLRPRLVILGWLGLAAILAAGWRYDAGTPFPGYHALLPTVGAVAVIAAGLGVGSRGVDRLLSARPLTWVGDRSYSLYLWHWPLVVVATYWLGHGLHFVDGLVVTLVALLLADLSYRLVERPVLDSTSLRGAPRKALAMGAVLMGVAALAGVLVVVVRPSPHPIDLAQRITSRSAAGGTASELGANYLAGHPDAGKVVDHVGHYSPSAAAAVQDVPDVYARHCHQDDTSVEPVACGYGPASARFRVALVGDSHAAQWYPTFQVLAHDYGWHVDSYTKSNCPLVDVPIVDFSTGGAFPSCTAWNRNVQSTLARTRPDLVVVATYGPAPLVRGRPVTGKAGSRVLATGLRSSWQQLTKRHIRVVALADTPQPGFNVPECLERHPDEASQCAPLRSIARARGDVVERNATRGLALASVVDLDDDICPGTRCAPVIGHVLVYRDDNHLTATYAATLARDLHEALQGVGALRAR